MSDQFVPPISTSSHPDLDWSQVRETIFMLKLAAAQVEFSLRDGNNSVDVLADSFTSMARSLSAIEKKYEDVAEEYNIQGEVNESITDLCSSVSGKMQHAIIAFQFYDKLVQRLDHVVDSLSQLGDLVGDPGNIYSPIAWQALQEKIRSKYTMRRERDLFDALMSGEDIDSVIKRMHVQIEEVVEEDDIELF